MEEKLDSLAGQKWELGRTEMRARQKIHIFQGFLSFLSVFCHFWLVSTIFSCFSSILDCFAAIHLQCLPIGRTVWHCNLAWQNRIGELGPPDRKKFWQEGLEFWQDGLIRDVQFGSRDIRVYGKKWAGSEQNGEKFCTIELP